MKKSMVLLLMLVVCFVVINTFREKSANSRGQPLTVPGLNMQFVYVAPGSFQMESQQSGLILRYGLTIKNGYWIGKYEVTQDEYQCIIGNNPSKFNGGSRPVEQVSWDDAVSFCQKLTERERTAGRLPSGYEYRLPMEVEWEFAASGGTASKGYKYSGSNNLYSVAWYNQNSNNATHEVGNISANELGIHDMSGNVWEWCLDVWHVSAAFRPDGRRWGDETGSTNRVLRGGSWGCDAENCRVANRINSSPSGSINTGFRVALAPSSNGDWFKIFSVSK